MTDDNHSRPSPEVPEKPTRRRFTAEYKFRVLEEADRCSEPGQVGELLRREVLYSSHLTLWRKQRESGTLNGLESKKRRSLRMPVPENSKSCGVRTSS